ncbi:MAG: flippase-like domain-containing protein [Nitrospirae bacterium]|nr:flippase-like domain-containing protein [Nitrospirota bacterium]
MNSSKNNNFVNYKNILRIIGIGLFIFIIRNIDFSRIASYLSKINITYLTAVLILNFPLILTKTFRWNSILKIQKIKLPLMDNFLIYYSTSFLGVISPGNIGEFMKAFYLKKEAGVPLSKGFLSSMLDRLFDLYLLSIIGTLGIWHLKIISHPSMAFAVLIALVSLPLILIVNKKLMGKCIRFLYNNFISDKNKNRVEKNFRDFYEDASELISPRLFISAILTCLGTFIFFIQSYLLVISLGLQAGFVTITIFMSVARLISLIPVSVSGIGTRDAILIYLFSTISLSPETAVTYSFLILLSLFVFNGLIGAIAWWIKPLDIRNLNTSAADAYAKTVQP